MKIDAATPAEYLERLEPDWRKDALQELRSLILKRGPDLDEGVRYGMLCYGDKSGGWIALGVQKHTVNLYVGSARKVDPDGALLAGLDVGKGSIRFTKSDVIEDTRIDEFVEKTVTMLRNGEDVGC